MRVDGYRPRGSGCLRVFWSYILVYMRGIVVNVKLNSSKQLIWVRRLKVDVLRHYIYVCVGGCCNCASANLFRGWGKWRQYRQRRGVRNECNQVCSGTLSWLLSLPPLLLVWSPQAVPAAFRFRAALARRPNLVNLHKAYMYIRLARLLMTSALDGTPKTHMFTLKWYIVWIIRDETWCVICLGGQLQLHHIYKTNWYGTFNPPLRYSWPTSEFVRIPQFLEYNPKLLCPKCIIF